MSSFVELIRAYREQKFPQLRPQYENLAGGQQPHTLLITCSDSRLCPQEFTQTEAGELFIIRNAGNLMPAYDAEQPSNEGLTLEYGVNALNVQQVVVCGHSSCGAMGGMMNLESLDALPLVQKGLQAYKEAHAHEVSELEDTNQAIAWNVQNQLKSLMTYPFVREKVAQNQLQLVGLVYNFTNANIEFNCRMSPQGEVLRD